MNIIRSLKNNRSAINAMVGWFMILIILATATAVILLMTQNTVEDKKNESLTGAIAKAFKELDKKVNNLLPSSPTSSKTEIPISSGNIEIDPEGDRIAVMYTFRNDFAFNLNGLDSFDLSDDINDIKNSITINMVDTGSGVKSCDRIEATKLEQSDGSFISGVLLQLYSNEYPSPTDPASGLVTFGSIWIFDLGRLTYETSGIGVNEKVIYENCAVIRENADTSYIEYSSNIKNEENNIIQLSVGLIRGSGVSVSGSGNYELDFEVLNHYVRNKVNTEVYHLKIMITGDNTDIWYDYLTNPIHTYDFSQSGDYLLFNNGQKTDLVFSTFVLKIIGT